MTREIKDNLLTSESNQKFSDPTTQILMQKNCHLFSSKTLKYRPKTINYKNGCGEKSLFSLLFIVYRSQSSVSVLELAHQQQKSLKHTCLPSASNSMNQILHHPKSSPCSEGGKS